MEKDDFFFLPFLRVTDSDVEGGMLKIPVNGFGTDLLLGKFGAPSGLGRLLRFLTGLSGGVFLGIRLAVVPPDPVLGDPSPC
jgi:hypothetical protein